MVKRKLSDSVTETLLRHYLRFERDENGQPHMVPASAFEGISFPIVDTLRLFRSVLSIAGQGYMISRSISTAAIPRVLLKILDGVAPIFHWILGESPDTVIGTYFR